MVRHRRPLAVRDSRPRRPSWRVAALVGATALIIVALAGPALGLPALGAKKALPGPPCTSSAIACVDLNSQRAWLMRDGAATRGPVPISSGAKGYDTPPGTFKVMRKSREHVSTEYGTPMPYSVFFTPDGIAFHEGSLDTASAGCIRLQRDDAIAFFDTLQVGDEVQVR